MSARRELALAAWAAARDAHIVTEPRGRGFDRFAASFDAAAFNRSLEADGVRWLARSDDAFPALLREIHDPPAGLFLRGRADADVLSRPSVAIVGARGCSAYGAGVARSLGRDLAAAGLVVVSGLARGIDGEAHRGAIEVGGVTVAVLGCGIDRDYPSAHRDLARRIAVEGLVVSEYAPGVAPAPWRFPARNRIVAGLCTVTIVVEARQRSGALITADFALDEGRDVFAVPGEITASLSEGSNALLRVGAAPLMRTRDILDHFGIEEIAQPAESVTVGAAARAVLEALRRDRASADGLARAVSLDPGAVAGALVELELAGLVTEEAGTYREVMQPH
jgi:DNA processing protein